jgi:hypothetical protein
MLFALPNPAKVPLQIVAQQLDGSPKLDIVSGTARVIYLNPGPVPIEVEVLPPTALVGAGATWRYVWEPIALAEGQYFVEYFLIDAIGLTSINTEDLVVSALATQVALGLVATDVTLIRKATLNGWKIVADQMIYYDDDGSTPLIIYNLYNELGLPSMTKVYERRVV